VGGSIPKGLWDKQEKKYTAQGNDHGQDPEDPAPSETANDNCTDKWDKVFATKQKKSVNANTVSSLVEEEDLGNRG
jgi:hypothetical protein